MDELKPCPFCGFPGSAWIDNGGQFPEQKYGCCFCLVETCSAEEWNNRTGEKRLQDLISTYFSENEKLRAELQAANEDADRLAQELELEQNPGYTCAALVAHKARKWEARG